jgi:hypothetical protein
MRAPTSLLTLAAVAAGCAAQPPAAPLPVEAVAVPPPATVAPPVEAVAPPPATVAPPAESPATAPPSAVASAPTVPAAQPAPAPPPRSAHPELDRIVQILKQNRRRFRICYEEYLGRTGSPNLQARVKLRFVIGRDGGVSNVSDAGSDLPDSEAMTCMKRAMYGLSFPQPKGGPMTITYPFIFTVDGSE